METYRGFVLAQETDSNGHMNVQFYTLKFDQATGQHLTRLGFDFVDLHKKNLGFAYVESTIRYIKEVLEDTSLHIESELVSVANKVVTVRHVMKDSVKNTLASDCVMKWVIFDKKTRKAIPISDPLRKRLKEIQDA